MFYDLIVLEGIKALESRVEKLDAQFKILKERPEGPFKLMLDQTELTHQDFFEQRGEPLSSDDNDDYVDHCSPHLEDQRPWL